jgi:hypothetical protein
MPTPAAGGAAAFLGSRLVYAGGATWEGGTKQWLKRVQVYDPASDAWTDGPALPTALGYGAYLRTADALEILGGNDGERTHRECWRLEVSAKQWQRSGAAPTDTLFGRAEAIAGRTYLFGGCSEITDLTRCTDAVFVREATEWRRISSLPQGKVAMPAAAQVRGRVYFFGGCSMLEPGKLFNRDEAYSFDPAGGAWRKLRSLPKANRGLTAVAVNDRYILLYGGYSATQQEAAGQGPEFGFTRAAFAYDVENDSYLNLGSGPLAAAGVELLYRDGTLFALGGEQRMRGRSERLMTARVKETHGQ